jgi:hypothetical protein
VEILKFFSHFGELGFGGFVQIFNNLDLCKIYVRKPRNLSLDIFAIRRELFLFVK